MINKFNKRLFKIIVHLFILPLKNMDSMHKKNYLPLFNINLFRSIREKMGYILMQVIIRSIEIEDSVYGIDFRMMDYGIFEYYILFSRNEIYEPALTHRLIDILDKNKSYTFIDVGAHYGYFTIIAGKVLGSGGKVISIEPNPKSYKRLLKNITINNLNEIVRTYNIGLSEYEGRAKMGSWDNRKTINDSRGSIVLMSFDELCGKEHITPDIIKIDVFGAEGNILSGMPETLRQVSHIFCELHEDMNGYTAKDIITMMESAGLEVFEFTRHRQETGGDIVPIRDEFFSDHVDRMLYGKRDISH